MAKATTKKSTVPAKPVEEQNVIDVGAVLPGEAPAVREDAEFVKAAGVAVLAFLKGALEFFQKAGQLEKKAELTLIEARAMRATPPLNGDQDRTVQNFILRTINETKAAEEHWSITKTISQFHRRMTGARARTTDKLEEANKVANGLHNTYVENERRRVEEENRRREAEERMRQEEERQRELDEMERKATEAEAAAPELSKREEEFVNAYTSNVSGWRDNGPVCARVAGYKKHIDDAARLLKLPKIQAAIKAKKEAQAIREQKEAAARRPLEPTVVDEVQPDIQKASGAKSKTTHRAELLNEQKLIMAILEGKNIPIDILQINESKLNKHANDTPTIVGTWPGVIVKKNTVTF